MWSQLSRKADLVHRCGWLVVISQSGCGDGMGGFERERAPRGNGNVPVRLCGGGGGGDARKKKVEKLFSNATVTVQAAVHKYKVAVFKLGRETHHSTDAENCTNMLRPKPENNSSISSDSKKPNRIKDLREVVDKSSIGLVSVPGILRCKRTETKSVIFFVAKLLWISQLWQQVHWSTHHPHYTFLF